MKRLIILAAGLAGSLFAIPAQAATSAPLPAAEPVATASGAAPSVVLTAVRTAPPLVKVTVVSGDTLSGIAASHPPSTWPGIAAFNHIAYPDLIYPGQVFTIPPASYRGSWSGSVQAAAPVTRYAPPQHTYVAPARTYSAPAPAPVVSYSGGGSFTGVWACIAQHESGGNAATNTGNGFYGGLQFTLGTWQANGGSGNPANASAAEQQRVAENVVRASGGSYGAWPVTSRMCGV